LADVLPVGVVVTPQTATLLVNDSVTLSASVVGAADGSVTWQVNGIDGGNATVGTISGAGLYTAPAAVPTPAAVTVTAVANADSRATASAQVTVTAPPPPPPVNPPASGGGGGGGAGLDLFALLSLWAGAVLLATRGRETRLRR
jgi:hypothetical protein